jgi:hypothetical protein
MARHHVISTTACDVFFKLVAHQKSSLGARFDSMIVTVSADGRPGECSCCGDDEQLEFVSQDKVPLAHADDRATLPTTAKNQNNRNLLAASKQLPRIRGIT